MAELHGDSRVGDGAIAGWVGVYFGGAQGALGFI